MSGEVDLTTILKSLTIRRLPEPVTMACLGGPVKMEDGILAQIQEPEGTTVVTTVGEAERRGWPVEFVGAWLTVEVHTSLEAVGLTAAISAALTVKEIPCNVLAGFYHDHLVVPWERADEAVMALEELAQR